MRSSSITNPTTSILVELRETLSKVLPNGWAAEQFESPDHQRSVVVLGPDDDAASCMITEGQRMLQLLVVRDYRVSRVIHVATATEAAAELMLHIEPANDRGRGTHGQVPEVTAHMAQLAQMLGSRLPHGWSAEPYESCDGTLGVMVMAAGDIVAESYAITPTGALFEMTLVAKDGIQETLKGFGIRRLVDVIEARTWHLQRAA